MNYAVIEKYLYNCPEKKQNYTRKIKLNKCFFKLKNINDLINRNIFMIDFQLLLIDRTIY